MKRESRESGTSWISVHEPIMRGPGVYCENLLWNSLVFLYSDLCMHSPLGDSSY
jgi:hypothetical protein